MLLRLLLTLWGISVILAKVPSGLTKMGAATADVARPGPTTPPRLLAC